MNRLQKKVHLLLLAILIKLYQCIQHCVKTLRTNSFQKDAAWAKLQFKWAKLDISYLTLQNSKAENRLSSFHD